MTNALRPKRVDPKHPRIVGSLDRSNSVAAPNSIEQPSPPHAPNNVVAAHDRACAGRPAPARSPTGPLRRRQARAGGAWGCRRRRRSRHVCCVRTCGAADASTALSSPALACALHLACSSPLCGCVAHHTSAPAADRPSSMAAPPPRACFQYAPNLAGSLTGTERHHAHCPSISCRSQRPPPAAKPAGHARHHTRAHFGDRRAGPVF